MQIVTSWMEEGIEEGIERGRQQEVLAIIQRLLTRRIGTISPELMERIRQLSLSQLEDLAEALLDFSESADVDAWLQRL